MIRHFVHIVYVIVIVAYIFLSALVHASIEKPMRLFGSALNIAPCRIYGKRAVDVQVYTFNHPSHLEKFVLFDVFGDYSAIARDMSDTLPVVNYVMDRIGCVLVKPKGGQKTTARALHKLRTMRKPFLVAMSSGIVSDEKIPKKPPTIAFRLEQRVQPLVIIYEGIPYTHLPDTLPKCWPMLCAPPTNPVQPHVFFLPPVDPKDFDSAEACAQYVRKQMMRVFAFARHGN